MSYNKTDSRRQVTHHCTSLLAEAFRIRLICIEQHFEPTRSGGTHGFLAVSTNCILSTTFDDKTCADADALLLLASHIVFRIERAHIKQRVELTTAAV